MSAHSEAKGIFQKLNGPNTLPEQVEMSLLEDLAATHKKREESLITTLEAIKKDYPNERIFVIVGSNHITTNPDLKGNFDLALKPKHQLSEEEANKKEEEFYGWNSMDKDS